MDKRFYLWLLLSTVFMVGLLCIRSFLPKKAEPPKPGEFVPHARTIAAGMGLTPIGLCIPSDSLVPRIHAAKHAEYLALEARRKKEQRERDIKAQNVPDEIVELGKDDPAAKLHVVFDKLTGGVRTLTLKERLAATVRFAEPEATSYVLLNDDYDGRRAAQSRDERVARQSYRFLAGERDIRWTLSEHSASKVGFTAKLVDVGVTVIRTFELQPGEYHLSHRLELQFGEDAKGEFTYELTGPRGLPVEGVVWHNRPFRQVVVCSVDAKETTLAYRKLVEPYALNPKGGNKAESIRPANDKREFLYAGVMVQYFGSFIVADGNPAENRMVETVTPQYLEDDVDYPKSMEKMQGHVSMRVTSRPIPALPGQTVSHNYLLYAGPVKVRLLNREAGLAAGIADRYEHELHLNLLTDSPSDNFLSKAFAYIGWNSMVVFLTNLMHRLLGFLVLITGNYGVAIIVMTLIVRGLMFPISRKQALASIRMQKLAPELKKLKEKYKDKKEEIMRATMQLYREQGVNPMSGCLILLLQMPVFLGLYYALYESIDLRLASFLWIDNLAVPDALFNWEGIWGVRWLASLINLGPTFNILPLVSVALMVIQQKYMTPPPTDEQQAFQLKMMNWMMILMAWMFYWVPAGLCVYFIVSGAWGILERKLLPKLSHGETPPSAAVPATTGPRRPQGDGGKQPGSSMLGKLAHLWQELQKKADKR
jgi:YidC/Oxa1 family membrane protein insertase